MQPQQPLQKSLYCGVFDCISCAHILPIFLKKISINSHFKIQNVKCDRCDDTNQNITAMRTNKSGCDRSKNTKNDTRRLKGQWHR